MISAAGQLLRHIPFTGLSPFKEPGRAISGNRYTIIFCRKNGKGGFCMKMITAIVNKEDSRQVCTQLVRSKFSVTRLSTTGGFLMTGNVTLMMGVEDQRVEECIEILRKYCSQHTEVVPSTALFGSGEASLPMTVTVGGATVFVTNVERFEKL